jgi:hypothetical protein
MLDAPPATCDVQSLAGLELLWIGVAFVLGFIAKRLDQLPLLGFPGSPFEAPPSTRRLPRPCAVLPQRTPDELSELDHTVHVPKLGAITKARSVPIGRDPTRIERARNRTRMEFSRGTTVRISNAAASCGCSRVLTLVNVTVSCFSEALS